MTAATGWAIASEYKLEGNLFPWTVNRPSRAAGQASNKRQVATIFDEKAMAYLNRVCKQLSNNWTTEARSNRRFKQNMFSDLIVSAISLLGHRSAS
jgi:hypothetical protein